MLQCFTCKEFRELQFFSKTKNKSKSRIKIPYYYWLKKCKICLGVKTIIGPYNKVDNATRVERKSKKNISLSPECLKFLNRLKMTRYHVDMLDSFKLAHYFIETFGYIDLDNLEIEDQLLLMLKKLLEINGDNKV